MSMPATAPFVVRNSTRRFVLQTILGLVLVLGGALLSFVFLTAGLILLIPGVFIVVMSVLSLRNRAPLLMADEQGLFVQAFRGEGGVRRFAWHDIERLYVHRIGRPAAGVSREEPAHLRRSLLGQPRRRQRQGSNSRSGAG